MALLSLLLLAAWTLVVIRLFAVRATLSDGVFLTYIMLGALMALTAAPLAEKFIIPYPLNEYNYGYLFGAFFRLITRNLVLLAPVIAYLFLRRMHRLTSVADAFLLAFAVGFGYELVGAVLATSTAPESLKGMTLFPPWQFTWDARQRFPTFGIAGEFGIAGVGYSIGLASLVLASMLRFWRRPRNAILVSVAVLLLVTAHEAMWAVQLLAVGHTPPTKGIGWFFDTIMFHGKLTALVTLLLLAYVSARELRWAAESTGVAPPDKFKLLEDCQRLLMTMLRGGPRDYLRASAHAGLQHQVSIVKAELALSANDTKILQPARLLDIKLSQAEANPGVPGISEPLAISAPLFDRRALQFAWGALALLILLMPRLPSWLPPYLWKFPLLNVQLPLLPFTVLHVALVLLSLWWFLKAPGTARSNWDPRELIPYYGDNTLSFAAMGAVLLVLFQVPLGGFYPPYSTLSFLNRASFPQFDASQVAALLLLVAVAANGVTLKGIALWRREASAEEQRAATIRRLLILANAMIFMWLTIKIYVPLLAALHKLLGPTFFDLFGRLGNVVMALVAALLFFGLSLGIGYALRLVTQRVERFLIGPVKA